MKVLHIKENQLPLVDGYKNGAHLFEAVQDGSGRYIAAIDCRTFEPFKDIWHIFNEMEEIEWTPFPEPEE